MNAVLERLRDQRAEQLNTIDAILAQVVDRDLVDAERNLLEAARQRVIEIDAQIEPLEAFEALRAAHADRVGNLPAPRGELTSGEPRRLDGADRAPVYPSPGAYLVDLIRAGGFMDRMGGPPDSHAAARIEQVRITNQTTANTPGILPTPIVGPIVSLIDAMRPLLTSLGVKPLGGIPGLTFSRPKVTQHVTVARQMTEKTELSSRNMVISPVNFPKHTYGGTVDISRQDIDWTSPSAWDALIQDLADVYSEQTETAIAAAFRTVAIANLAEVVDDDTLLAWALALYAAAARSYAAAKKMPDRIWCSLDVWAVLGALTDIARLVFPPGAGPGTAELGTFQGDVLGLPRIVVPTFAAGTLVIGNSTVYEVYEEVIGLLSVIEPSILGVTVAYGGYVAHAALEGTALIPVTPPAAALARLTRLNETMKALGLAGNDEVPAEAAAEAAPKGSNKS
jgi:hypothetical protein